MPLEDPQTGVNQPNTTADGDPIYPGRIIGFGENNNSIVRPIQLRLKACGCGDLQGTGFFGVNTDEAVRLFQTRFSDLDGRPLEVDGEVGPLTWGALFGADAVPKQDTATGLLEKALEKAETQVGIREQPRGTNDGPEVRRYLQSVGLDPGNAWCMAFIYWCFEQARLELGMSSNPLTRTGHVLTHWNKAGENNIRRISKVQATYDPSLVRPGMIFIIDTGSPGGTGHTGLVEKVIGGRLITIEGNTNNNGSREGIGVFRRDGRKISSINKGFIDYGD